MSFARRTLPRCQSRNCWCWMWGEVAAILVPVRRRRLLGQGRSRVAERDGRRKDFACKEGARTRAHRHRQPGHLSRRLLRVAASASDAQTERARVRGVMSTRCRCTSVYCLEERQARERTRARDVRKKTFIKLFPTRSRAFPITSDGYSDFLVCTDPCVLDAQNRLRKSKHI